MTFSQRCRTSCATRCTPWSDGFNFCACAATIRRFARGRSTRSSGTRTRCSEWPSACIVNVGNQHTLALLVRGEELFGVMEHHTESMTTEKLERLVGKLIAGTITHEEVFDDDRRTHEVSI